MSNAIAFSLGLWIGAVIGIVAGMVLSFDRRAQEKEGNEWESSGQ